MCAVFQGGGAHFFSMKVKFTTDECMQLYDAIDWNVYAEACVGGDMVMCTTQTSEADTASPVSLDLERSFMELADDCLPVRLCFTITAPTGHELPLSNLHILLTVYGFVNNRNIIQWTSYLGPDKYDTHAFDVVQNMPIMNMDTEGLHHATAFYTETFPRKWKGIELFISPIAVHRVLNEE